MLLWPGINAINVDTLEPRVIRSPAMNVDLGDGFGWTALLHQTEVLQEGDTMAEALRKTR